MADDVVVQFVRSGGAGGQNVNKGALLLHPGCNTAAERLTRRGASLLMSVNTKADIRFAVQRADFLPAWVKANLVQQEKNRMNSEGELVVNSSRHRTQKCVRKCKRACRA